MRFHSSLTSKSVPKPPRSTHSSRFVATMMASHGHQTPSSMAWYGLVLGIAGGMRNPSFWPKPKIHHLTSFHLWSAWKYILVRLFRILGAIAVNVHVYRCCSQVENVSWTVRSVLGCCSNGPSQALRDIKNSGPSPNWLLSCVVFNEFQSFQSSFGDTLWWTNIAMENGHL